MRVRSNGVVFCMVLLTAGAMAQTTYVTTTGGTAGTIPEFTGRSSIGKSVITQTGTQVGIGASNTSAVFPLQVQSNYVDGGGIAMVGVVNASEGDYAWAEFDSVLRNPNASTPDIYNWNIGSEGSYSASGELTGQDMYIYDPRNGIYNFAVDGQDNVYIGGKGYFNGAPSVALFADVNGNVGLGTFTPSARLEVNGNIKVTGSISFADGTVQTTATPGVARTMPGGDFAESVDVTGDRTRYEPGDVMVIDSSAPGKFLKSAEPYSTSVSGIYSTKPGNVGRRQTTPQSDDEVPMAMMGIVPTKVTAENGPVRAGDLLVTSSTMGYAMKGTDRNKMLGAVIGKALGSLDSGKGVIEVVVTLQ